MNTRKTNLMKFLIFYFCFLILVIYINIYFLLLTNHNKYYINIIDLYHL